VAHWGEWDDQDDRHRDQRQGILGGTAEGPRFSRREGGTLYGLDTERRGVSQVITKEFGPPGIELKARAHWGGEVVS